MSRDCNLLSLLDSCNQSALFRSRHACCVVAMIDRRVVFYVKSDTFKAFHKEVLGDVSVCNQRTLMPEIIIRSDLTENIHIIT